jgi:mRNA interferase MazF
MGKFIKGDIVVVPFPFSDLSSSKRRPALVLSELKGNDIILCQITSKNIYDDMAVKICVSDIENGSLNDTSNIRPNKLFTADESIILYKIGNLNKIKLQEITEKIINMFSNTKE